jgi:hypothetical protein
VGQMHSWQQRSPAFKAACLTGVYMLCGVCLSIIVTLGLALGHGEPPSLLLFLSVSTFVNPICTLGLCSLTLRRIGREPASDTSKSMTFPRIWELFPIILPKAVRERIYEPYHEELKEDYLEARKRFRTPWAKQWIWFAFTWRTAWAVAHCLWVAFGETLWKIAVRLFGFLAGARAVEWVREVFVAIWGRLP